MQDKKALKSAYKQMQFRMGVFQIRNTANGKVFVSSSTDLDRIYNRHRMQLNFGNHQNDGPQADWKELGEEHFRYETLGEVQHREGEPVDYQQDVKELEERYLEELQPYDEKGYNRRPA